MIFTVAFVSLVRLTVPTVMVGGVGTYAGIVIVSILLGELPVESSVAVAVI